MDDLSVQLTVMPEAESVAVGVDQVRERLQFCPLFGVVAFLFEFPRIGAFAGRLDLDEADQRVVDRDGEIGTALEFCDMRLADQLHRVGRQPIDLCQIAQKHGDRLAQLLLRLALDRGRIELRFRGCAESGNGGGETFLWQNRAPNQSATAGNHGYVSASMHPRRAAFPPAVEIIKFLYYDLKPYF
jgi:hypothetical protein